MHLTKILHHIKIKFPNGHIFRGKYRLVKQVTPEALGKMRTDVKIEERNMYLLRHPYLSVEQSYGHSKALNKNYENFGKMLDTQRLKFKNNVTLEQRLGHLRHGEAWEEFGKN